MATEYQSGAYYRGNEAGPMLGGDVRKPGNARVFPRFFLDPRKNADGIFVDVEMVEYLIAGDNKAQPVQKVTDAVKSRFRDEYRAWKDGLEQTPNGTPVEMMLGKTSAALNLRARHVFTLEQLAELSDGACQEMGLGSAQLRTRAKTFLAQLADTKEAERLAIQNQQKDERLAQMEETIRALQAAIAKQESNPDTPTRTTARAGSSA